MNFGFALHLATFLTAGSAFAAAAAGGNLNSIFTYLWLAGFVLAILTPERRLKSGVVLAVGLLAGPILIVLIIRSIVDPILAAVYFAAILLLARLLSRRGAEGHSQTILLSVLVLAGGGAVTPDLVYLPILVFYLFSITFGLLLAYLRREEGDTILALPVREVVGKGLFGGTVLLAVFALAFTAISFLLFPRFTFGVGMARSSGGNEVGLSDRVELSGFGRLKENDRVVLRVWLDKSEGELDVYWRAQPVEIYDGSSWLALPRSIDRETASSLTIRTPSGAEEKENLVAEVVSNLGIQMLPVPDQALRIRVLPVEGKGGRVQIRSVGDKEVRLAGDPRPPYSFVVELEPGRRVVDRTPPTDEHLQLPEQHPAVSMLASRLAKEAMQRQVSLPDSLESWLSSTFSYSAELPIDTSLEHFLLQRQAGHCEYFATAMAVLLRLEGVPARVVIGLHGGRWNAAGGYYSVRQGDAHTWVEAWHEGEGWKRYEPTPRAGIGRGVDPPTVAERLADLWDSMQASWARNVLGFDRSTQRDLFTSVASTFEGVGRAFDRNEQSESLSRSDMLKIILVFTVLTLALILIRRHFSKRASDIGLSIDAKRARRVYRTLNKNLRGLGIDRGAGETTDDLLEALAKLDSLNKETVSRVELIVDRYNMSRFGGRPMPPDEARDLIEEAKASAKALVEQSCR